MHDFKIWAPRTRSMTLKLKSAELQMRGPDCEGWWHLEVAEAVHGTEYGFSIDDDPAVYPDPRSLWQPDGVHEMSRVYDQSAFTWNDAEFEAKPLPQSVILQLQFAQQIIGRMRRHICGYAKFAAFRFVLAVFWLVHDQPSKLLRHAI